MSENYRDLVLTGSFYGVLRWHQFDALWNNLKLRSEETWYIYAVGQEMPVEPVNPLDFLKFLGELETLLKQDHQEDYCGIVYVDDTQYPNMVKIYDPNNLGASCGSSGELIPPGWVISKLKPEDLTLNILVSKQRRRWWQALFRH